MASNYPAALDGAFSTHQDAYDAIAAVQATVGVNPRAPLPFVAGTWWDGGMPSSGTGQLITAANRGYAAPYFFPHGCTVDAVGVLVTTAVAAATATLLDFGAGSNPDGQTGVNIGSIDVSAAVAVQVNLASAISIARGYRCFGVLCGASAPRFRVNYQDPIGTPSALLNSAAVKSDGVQTGHLKQGYTVGTAWSTDQASTTPRLVFRIASIT